MKPTDLIWKAQPMIAVLREIAKFNGHEKIVARCDEWLRASHIILSRKDKKGKAK